jgi:hypothetical protein
MAIELTDQQRLERAVRSLRNYIRDKKELNSLLLGNFETSDEEARQAVISALIDWNSTPPLIQPVSLASHPNKQLLIQCAALECLQSSGIWHSREHMPSADGGTSGDDHAKASEYSGWIERLYSNYERKKSDLKLALNIQEALTGMALASEYAGSLAIYGEFW